MYFGNKNGCGYRSVEAIDVPHHRDLDDEIAMFEQKPRDAKTFRADNKSNRTLVIDFIVFLGCFTVAAHNPETVFLKGLCSLGEIGHYRNLDVSTLKELAKRWCPEVAQSFKKRQAHTALADFSGFPSPDPISSTALAKARRVK